MKFSTAKSILRTFRKEGRIGKKKTRNMNKSNLQKQDFNIVKTLNVGYVGQIPSQVGSCFSKAAFILFKEFKLDVSQKNDQVLPKFENLLHLFQAKNAIEKFFGRHLQYNQEQYNQKLLNCIRQQQIAQLNVKTNLFFGNLWRQTMIEELMKGNLYSATHYII